MRVRRGPGRAAVGCFALAVLWLGSAWPVCAQSAPPITVHNSSVHYAFGQQAVFSLEASAPAGVTSAYLYLQLQGEDRTEVRPVDLEPGPVVQVRLEWDLRLFPFPPFGQVSWWWEVRDGAGNSLRTEPTSFLYVDNRFEWVAASDGPVWVHAVVDDPVYIQAALDVARSALERIQQQLQAPPLERVDLYLYPSLQDLRAALEMAGREWAGGQARPELGVVLVAIPPGDGAIPQMERDIPHELTHLLIYHTVGPEGYRYVPAWLDEGLATANQWRPDPNMDAVLEAAHARGRLIPLMELCAPFPANREVAELSYAQSGSLVRYIQGRYGNTGIRALLAAYADGAGCEGGIIEALDITPQRLELAWRAHLMGLSGWMAWLSDNGPWLFLWGLSVLLAIPMVGGLGRRAGRAGARGE